MQVSIVRQFCVVAILPTHGELACGFGIGSLDYGANIGEWVTVITGTIFVICVLAFRRGIVGELAVLFKK